jgi:CheY-like chemotaxis protein
VLEKNALGGRALLAEIRTAVRNGLAQRRDTGEDSGAVAAVSAEHDEVRDSADEAPAPARADGLHILYVEDNEDNIVLLQGRLVDRGYAVSIARDGREGVVTARAERPDLILMDMSLPVMDGWEATRELKGDPATAAIPVIGVSAHAIADRYRGVD